MVSILILLDYLFLYSLFDNKYFLIGCFNPYFIGLPILMIIGVSYRFNNGARFNPYFIGLPILIGYKNYLSDFDGCFNPYFIGLPILIFKGEKNEKE